MISAWATLFGSRDPVLCEEVVRALRNPGSENASVSDAVAWAELQFVARPWGTPQCTGLSSDIRKCEFEGFLARFGSLDACLRRCLYLLEVDSTGFPLCVVPWYHGSIPRDTAEALLRERPVGSFLVRASTSEPDKFAVSYVNGAGDRRILHSLIAFDYAAGGYELRIDGLRGVLYPNLLTCLQAGAAFFIEPVQSELSRRSASDLAAVFRRAAHPLPAGAMGMGIGMGMGSMPMPVAPSPSLVRQSSDPINTATAAVAGTGGMHIHAPHLAAAGSVALLSAASTGGVSLPVPLPMPLPGHGHPHPHLLMSPQDPVGMHAHAHPQGLAWSMAALHSMRAAGAGAGGAGSVVTPSSGYPVTPTPTPVAVAGPTLPIASTSSSVGGAGAGAAAVGACAFPAILAKCLTSPVLSSHLTKLLDDLLQRQEYKRLTCADRTAGMGMAACDVELLRMVRHSDGDAADAAGAAAVTTDSCRACAGEHLQAGAAAADAGSLVHAAQHFAFAGLYQALRGSKDNAAAALLDAALCLLVFAAVRRRRALLSAAPASAASAGAADAASDREMRHHGLLRASVQSIVRCCRQSSLSPDVTAACEKAFGLAWKAGAVPATASGLDTSAGVLELAGDEPGPEVKQTVQYASHSGPVSAAETLMQLGMAAANDCGPYDVKRLSFELRNTLQLIYAEQAVAGTARRFADAAERARLLLSDLAGSDVPHMEAPERELRRLQVQSRLELCSTC